jgi:ADP-ribosyl-[dinitrogen reductase] hydrolase
MFGAIIGDIVGSRFEFNNHRSNDFDFFNDDCQATDDTIMTLAVAKAIMGTEKIMGSPFGGYDFDSDYYPLLENLTIKYMQEIGRKYPNCGYGGMFGQWVFSDNPTPYNSFGNGAAMRISPVGFAARTESEACRLSEIVTGITHNHDEGMKGAEATAVAIIMARRGFTKSEIRKNINRNYYSLDFTIDEIRETYQFNETCQETVPQAIEAFLESTSFEDAIRTAISVGGDSDTLAAITGAIAEAYYGIHLEIKEKALTYLDKELRTIFNEWREFADDVNSYSKFKVLTKYIGKLSDTENFGDWIFDRKNDGSSEHPIQMPFINYDELVKMFVDEF